MRECVFLCTNFSHNVSLRCICNCRLEFLIFKLEVLDHKARERAGVITPTLDSPIPVLLQLDAAIEVNFFFFDCVYSLQYEC